MNCQICNEVFPSNKRSGEKTDYVKHYRSVHNDIPPEFKGKTFKDSKSGMVEDLKIWGASCNVVGKICLTWLR